MRGVNTIKFDQTSCGSTRGQREPKCNTGSVAGVVVEGRIAAAIWIKNVGTGDCNLLLHAARCVAVFEPCDCSTVEIKRASPHSRSARIHCIESEGIVAIQIGVSAAHNVQGGDRVNTALAGCEVHRTYRHACGLAASAYCRDRLAGG